MNRKTATLLMALITATALIWPNAAAAGDDDSASMTIARFLTCQDVMDHEPLGVSEVFPANTDRVFAFLEARDISADVTVNFVWIYQDNEVARVPLNLRQGSRWRTYSSKKITGYAGNWRVELRDNSDNVLTSTDFTVE